jgi:hypothetical protein
MMIGLVHAEMRRGTPRHSCLGPESQRFRLISIA